MISFALALSTAAPCLTATEPCSEPVAITSSGRFVSVFRNYPLKRPNTLVDRAIVMVHGAGRNADGYFRTSLAAAAVAGRLNETLLIAPDFKGNDGRACKDPLLEGELAFPCGAWKEGAAAINPSPGEQAYSFNAVDRLVALLNNHANFPNLKTIVIAGHSAGGQFLVRYAAANKAEPSSAIPIRYVAANPSTYVYLNDLRLPHRATCSLSGTCTAPFARYQDAENCTTFNRYLYGLENRTGYLAEIDDATLKDQLARRNMTYLLGDLDAFDDGSMDTTCAARAQGANRRERGLNYWNYIRSQFKAEHQLQIVPNCGHSATCIFASDAGVRALYK